MYFKLNKGYKRKIGENEVITIIFLIVSIKGGGFFEID